MNILVPIPKRIVEELEKKNLSIEDTIIDALSKYLNLDPRAIIEIRLELAEKFLVEGREYLAKKDPIQASEKLYKVVEECIKALTLYFNLENILREVEKMGRWSTWLLSKASKILAKKSNQPKIEFVWTIAYDIHVWGFHEAKHGIDEVRMDLPHIEWLLNYTKQAITKPHSKRKPSK